MRLFSFNLTGLSKYSDRTEAPIVQGFGRPFCRYQNGGPVEFRQATWYRR